MGIITTILTTAEVILCVALVTIYILKIIQDYKMMKNLNLTIDIASEAEIDIRHLKEEIDRLKKEKSILVDKILELQSDNKEEE